MKIAEFVKSNICEVFCVERIADLLDILLLLGFTSIEISIHGACVATIGHIVLFYWNTPISLAGCISFQAIFWLLVAQIANRPFASCWSQGAWIGFSAGTVALLLVNRSLEVQTSTLVAYFAIVAFRTVVFSIQLRRYLSTASFVLSEVFLMVTLTAISLGISVSRWDRSVGF